MLAQPTLNDILELPDPRNLASLLAPVRAVDVRPVLLPRGVVAWNVKVDRAWNREWP